MGHFPLVFGCSVFSSCFLGSSFGFLLNIPMCGEWWVCFIMFVYLCSVLLGIFLVGFGVFLWRFRCLVWWLGGGG